MAKIKIHKILESDVRNWDVIPKVLKCPICKVKYVSIKVSLFSYPYYLIYIKPFAWSSKIELILCSDKHFYWVNILLFAYNILSVQTHNIHNIFW